MALKVQVTALGNSRAGKTHLLLAMYASLADYAQQGIRVKAKRLSIPDINAKAQPAQPNQPAQPTQPTQPSVKEYVGLDADAYLSEQYSELLLNGKWQSGTAIRTFLEFELYAGNQSLVDFTWIDYKGGAIEGAGVVDQDTQQLYKDLAKSSAIVVVADSHKILREQVEVAARTTGAARIQHLIQEFRDTHRSKALAISIVPSKFDVVADKATDLEEFKKRAYTLFADVVGMVENPRPGFARVRGAFIPVSIPARNGATYLEEPGEGFTKRITTTLTAPPVPTNSHLPVIYCIAREMEFEKERLMVEKRALYQQYNKLNMEINANNDWWSKLLSDIFNNTSSNFRETATKLIAKSQEIDNLESKLTPLINVAQKIAEIDSSHNVFAQYYR